jgi:hypothetical protein
MSKSGKDRYINDDEHAFKKYRFKTTWNKGIEVGPMTEEEKEKRSKTLKERWKTHKHHAIGSEPWNKCLKGVQ